jgi:hypothetical protein
MKRRLNSGWLAGVIAASTLSSPSAYAQLKNCASLNSNPGDYKVVLDDFAFASDAAKSNADLAALRDRLQFNFNGQLDLLKASARKLDRNLQVPMRLVFCAGRRPSLEGSEFTEALAERLSDERVVVEMWGTLDVRSNAGGAVAPRAMIGYAIPPVQHYHTDDEAPPIHVLAYPKSGAPQSAEELENLPELSAFALVGLGTKAARANRYDLAVWAFTGAEAGIRDAQLAGSNQGLDALLAYVKRAACLTRASARSDQRYSGPLTLVPAQTCGDAP